MESLESKLERLSPDQRKEVEDFVDFLLFRSGNSLGSPATAPVPPQIEKIAPPPLIVQEPVHILETPQVRESGASQGENPSIPVPQEEPATPSLEIVTGDDRITRDYMDYGQFEKNPSPATIAVKNVKEKLQKREEQEKPRVSLDWID